MIETRDRATRHSWTWFVQAFTGVLLLILLSLHMIAQHFIVEGVCASSQTSWTTFGIR